MEEYRKNPYRNNLNSEKQRQLDLFDQSDTLNAEHLAI